MKLTLSTNSFALLGGVALAAASLAACDEANIAPPHDGHNVPTATASTPPPPPRSTDPGSVDEAALDPAVSPCDDFYQHACGGWIKATQIPAEEASWTRSFDVLSEQNEKLLKEMVEKDAKSPSATEPYAKEIGDYYATCMDEDAIEKAGAEPLKPIFASIDKVKDAKSFATIVGDLQRQGVDVLFGFDSGNDFKDATQVIGQLDQGGIGLPERDYYLKDDAKMKEIRGKYEEHIARMFVLAGEKEADAKAHAKLVMAFETTLARASMSNVDRRDPQKVYHRIDRAGLEKGAPDFVWSLYFKAIGAPDVTAINVATPDFFRTLGQLMSLSPSQQCNEKAPKKGDAKADAKKDLVASPFDCTTQPKKFPAADVKAYLRFKVLSSMARSMAKRFVDESFSLERTLSGAESLPPRWKRCVRGVNFALGEALASPFVAKTLGDEGKASVKQMVANIEAAQAENLTKLAWMDDATRGKAKEKLVAIANKIGYPDKLRRYDGLVIKRGDTIGNRIRAFEFEAKRRLAKIGKPVDRNEWGMLPQQVNAYYDPTMNEMVFPAAILQSPFFSLKASAPANYGAIGLVIGHELTHGFDDEGRQFDARGNLADWWSEPVGKEFDKRAECVSKQFDGYVAVDDVHVNGKLTLGENLADLGGLKLSFEAWKKASNGARGNQKYTDEQQFFYGFAQSWCTADRKEFLRMLAQTNPHSPSRFRVNGPISNSASFQEAFQCKAGSPMVRAERCEVW
jgi:endothelin-converting enzyme/putative endopeptidase